MHLSLPCCGMATSSMRISVTRPNGPWFECTGATVVRNAGL